jgi:DNA-directed RNA polymerase beta' subunit
MTEFTCHIGSGRKALMETALETAVSGYIYRKVDYFLMDALASYSGEIRLSDSLLISPTYSGINIDVKYLVSQKCEFLVKSPEYIKEKLNGVNA